VPGGAPTTPAGAASSPLQDLWLRYWALGGNADWLDLDGYLAGVLPLGHDQQVVLLQALRERRFELMGLAG
jgi:hypothetical protein